MSNINYSDVVKRDIIPLIANLERLEQIENAAQWLVNNKGTHGEQQAWKLLLDALKVDHDR
jgi:tyrosine-protein phosphatase YwqE